MDMIPADIKPLAVVPLAVCIQRMDVSASGYLVVIQPSVQSSANKRARATSVGLAAAVHFNPVPAVDHCSKFDEARVDNRHVVAADKLNACHSDIAAAGACRY